MTSKTVDLDIKLDDKTYTKYERARIIGARALQISQGAPFAIKLTKKKLEEIEYNPLEIAKLEFQAGKIPIDVRRPGGAGKKTST
jgi:DNA-directed RNA polymerase subunit K